MAGPGHAGARGSALAALAAAHLGETRQGPAALGHTIDAAEEGDPFITGVWVS